MQQVNHLNLSTIMILMLKPLRGSGGIEKFTVSVNERDCLMHYHMVQHQGFINELPLFLTKSDGHTIDMIVNVIRQSSTYEITEYHFSPTVKNNSKVKDEINGLKSIA